MFELSALLERLEAAENNTSDNPESVIGHDLGELFKPILVRHGISVGAFLSIIPVRLTSRSNPLTPRIGAHHLLPVILAQMESIHMVYDVQCNSNVNFNYLVRFIKTSSQLFYANKTR